MGHGGGLRVAILVPAGLFHAYYGLSEIRGRWNEPLEKWGEPAWRSMHIPPKDQ